MTNIKRHHIYHAKRVFRFNVIRCFDPSLHQAYLAVGDFVEGEADIKRALAEDPANVGVRLLQKQYKQKVPQGAIQVDAYSGPISCTLEALSSIRHPGSMSSYFTSDTVVSSCCSPFQLSRS